MHRTYDQHGRKQKSTGAYYDLISALEICLCVETELDPHTLSHARGGHADYETNQLLGMKKNIPRGVARKLNYVFALGVSGDNLRAITKSCDFIRNSHFTFLS